MSGVAFMQAMSSNTGNLKRFLIFFLFLFIAKQTCNVVVPMAWDGMGQSFNRRIIPLPSKFGDRKMEANILLTLSLISISEGRILTFHYIP